MIMTREELKEFNDFLQESPVRNQFLPVLHHITTLKAKDLDVSEYKNKQDKPVVTFQFNSDAGRLIEGRVCFDWCGDINPSVKDNVIFEFWWDEECYCLLDNPIQAQNMVSCLLGKLKNKDPYISKTIRKSTELLEVI